MNEDRRTDAKATPPELAAFRHDRFVLGQALAVSAKYCIGDERGRPVLVMTTPARLGRLILGVLAATSSFFLMMLFGMVVLSELQVFDLVEVLVLVVGSALIAAWVFFAVLGRQTLRFFDPPGETAKSPCRLELRPAGTLPLMTRYEVVDATGVCLAHLYTNHLLNVLRTRWYGHGPDGTLLVIAEEDVVLPAFIRRPLRNGVGLCFMVLLLAAILGVGEGQIRLVLLLLAVIVPLFQVVFFWLLPSCVFFKPDLQARLGILVRNAKGPQERNLLDLTLDKEHYLDRRVALALGVLMYQR